MKILFPTIARLASRDANAIQIDRMCVANGRGRHEVTLTAIGQRPDGVRNYDLRMLPWRYVRLRNRLMQAMTTLLIRRLRPDILFTRSPLLALSGLRQAVQTVVELHSLPDHGSKTRAALKTSLTHPQLRRIVTISQALADDLVAEFGQPHPGCDIVVAHDGAEAGPRPGPATAHGGAVRVGYFGHLYPGKGMETIAAVAPLVPDLQFDIYGGTETDLARWRADCAGQSNINLHGYIPHAEVSMQMAKCDILIAPYAAQVSHVGGGDIGRWMSPLKLFEYMAAERPIVAADLPVLREVVRDGETALLCPAGDAAAFADALRRLAADRSLRARIGAAGRDLLEAEYTWDRRAERVLDGIMPKSAA